MDPPCVAPERGPEGAPDSAPVPELASAQEDMAHALASANQYQL
jgi:hypothetical protein